MHDAARIHVLAFGAKGGDGALIVKLEIEWPCGVVFKGLVGPCLPAGKFPGFHCTCGHSASPLFLWGTIPHSHPSTSVPLGHRLVWQEYSPEEMVWHSMPKSARR